MATVKRKIFYILLLTTVFSVAPFEAFNLDTKHAQIFRRPNTGFGYSVDFGVFRRSNNQPETKVLVGAPFAQSAQNQRLRNTGAVFGCEVDSGRCVEIQFDQKRGNELRLNGSALLPIEEKSNQMFGATVVASKNADSVLACAPHYKYFFSKFEVIEPVGTCFYAQNSFTKIQEFAPCRQEPARHGRHRLGYGMCGFSAAVPDDGTERLFISGPGVWYWQGAIFSQNVQNATDRPNVPAQEGPAHTDHYQLGYSTASGDFDGDGQDDVVVGVPRGNELFGSVSIYTRSLQPIANLTDPWAQRGQYFGASLAVLDLNNDGLMDLVVGSPLYIDYKSGSQQQQQSDSPPPPKGRVKQQQSTSVYSGKSHRVAFEVKEERKPNYDIGKITVFIRSGPRGFKDPIQIVGHGQWGRFGFSLASGGDLNGDGFQDLIVGAPYDGEDGRGVIYIYHGAESGITKQFVQRIQARDINNRELRTFGFSLKGGRDADGNGYPDIVVGAQQSSQAVVLFSRPVIQVTGSARTTRKTINLDEKLCVTEFGRMPCEKLKVCLKYAGKLSSEYHKIDVKLNIVLDTKMPTSPRAFFAKRDLDRKRGVQISPSAISRDQPDKIEQSIQLTKDREYCENYDVYIPDTIRDKISPIVLFVNYSYVERGGPKLEPAIDTTLGQPFETELNIEKNCGEDNICTPDLRISAIPAIEKFTVGTTDQTLKINVTVMNHGEDSYLTQYQVRIPPGFEYGGIENYETKQSVVCSPSEEQSQDSEGGGQLFVCDIGNPLPAGQRAAFGFKMTGTPDLDVSKGFVEIEMGTNSTNEEAPSRDQDNVATLRIPIEINAQINLNGRSEPAQVDYLIRNRTLGEMATFDFEVGPIVSHLFEVINRGPSAINSATLDIFWPSFSETGKHFLYLIDMPFISDPSKAKCRIVQAQNINPANLAISIEHVPTPAPPFVPGQGVKGSSGADLDKEEDFDTTAIAGERYSPSDDDMDEDDVKRLRRRQVDEAAVRRNLKKQRQAMKEAALLAKKEGVAVEYHGPLSRSTVNCAALNCTQIECDIGRLEEGESVLVQIFSRLWTNTLIDDELHEADISSLAIAKIASLPQAPRFAPLPQLIAVKTNVNPIDSDQGFGLPWWLWLVAILIAILILILIIFCCYLAGFFKRNRPPPNKATLSRVEQTDGQFADNGARYAQPQLYSPERHGSKV